ncbi:MAG: metallophosphoesterase [Myxococcota bacterium]|nr:metallophosphoesterase [Myxococcota bacterium]
MSRTIVIGDVHGCYEELMLLLKKLSFSDEDEVICVGDLIDRGPNPRAVVEFFMQHDNAHSLLGNHEDKHIRIHSGELTPALSQKICIEELGDFWHTAVAYFQRLPLWLERKGFHIVHAGILPFLRPNNQPRNVLLRGRMPWMASHYDKSHGGWWKYYNGSPVVYGHVFHREVHIENNTFGIDTGACHGGHLTAFVLDNRQMVQVRSAEDYWRIQRDQYRKKRRGAQQQSL